jgi:hypothetical protein
MDSDGWKRQSLAMGVFLKQRNIGEELGEAHLLKRNDSHT